MSIGGYSALDAAKLSTVITVFAIYEDWDNRPPGLCRWRSSATCRTWKLWLTLLAIPFVSVFYVTLRQMVERPDRAARADESR